MNYGKSSIMNETNLYKNCRNFHLDFFIYFPIPIFYPQQKSGNIFHCCLQGTPGWKELGPSSQSRPFSSLMVVIFPPAELAAMDVDYSKRWSLNGWNLGLTGCGFQIFWLVVDLPLWKCESQLGWWHSQLNGKIKIHLPNHQPVWVFGFCVSPQLFVCGGILLESSKLVLTGRPATPSLIFATKSVGWANHKVP